MRNAANTKTKKTSKFTVSREDKACDLFTENPDITSKELGIALGCTRQAVEKMPQLNLLKETYERNKNDLTRGKKDGETRQIEAWK